MISTRLLELLACPACHGMLRPEPNGELLRSSCGLAFPIVDGIPRLFAGEMRRIYTDDFPDWVRRYPELGTPDVIRREAKQKLKTRESFGYEWTVYHQMLPQWSENAKFYFEPIGLDRLEGQCVLDAGCGKGRHTYYAARAGAEVVALDFSRAIEVARKNCDGAGICHFVQGDLTAPPFQPGCFDLVYSFGVLHHLPDPEAGFQGLLALVRPGGSVSIYVYHWPEGHPIRQLLLSAVSGIRVLTTRMPFPALRAFSALIGLGLYGGVVLPQRALSHIPWISKWVAKLPLGVYARYPLAVLVNDQFDRFSAPIENRYRQGEVRAWLERAGLDEIQLLPGYGWRAAGKVPPSRTIQ